MKWSIAFLVLCAGLAACESLCVEGILDYKGECSRGCDARYGHFGKAAAGLKDFLEEHIMLSYRYLMMSVHFGSYEQNREGFRQYFRKLSDEAWEDTIKIIKYNSLRGNNMTSLTLRPSERPTEVDERKAMVDTLSNQKSLADKGHWLVIHSKDRDQHCHVDPEFVSFMENNFLHKQAKLVYELSGHVNDLIKLSRGEEARGTKELAYSLFDDYIQSS